MERKAALRQMIHGLPADSRLRFADHVERSGVQLFERVCKLDLEGIVAKYKFGPYGDPQAMQGCRREPAYVSRSKVSRARTLLGAVYCPKLWAGD